MPIDKKVTLGKNVKIFHPRLVNLYGCTIGENCIIGAFVEIRKGVKIGKNCKIQAGVFIPEGVTIGDNVFIGPHVTFTNDLFPRALNPDGTQKTDKDWHIVPTFVKKGASIGAGATIRCGITIYEDALVGAGSVVVSDVPANTIVIGNPARVLRKLNF